LFRCVVPVPVLDRPNFACGNRAWRLRTRGKRWLSRTWLARGCRSTGRVMPMPVLGIPDLPCGSRAWRLRRTRNVCRLRRTGRTWIGRSTRRRWLLVAIFGDKYRPGEDHATDQHNHNDQHL